MVSLKKQVKGAAKKLPGKIAKRFKNQQQKDAEEDLYWEEVSRKKKEKQLESIEVEIQKKRKVIVEDTEFDKIVAQIEVGLEEGLEGGLEESNTLEVEGSKAYEDDDKDDDDDDDDDTDKEITARALVLSERKRLKKKNKGQLSNNVGESSKRYCY
jgi:hypothetical protein